MKLVIIGANGKIGSRITEEALSRGHSITGIVRNPDSGVKNENVTWVKANALDSEALASVIKGHDAVISAFGIDWSKPETYPLFTDMANSIIAAAKKAGVKRLLVVGGA
jgi:putative NADH-flavin reductase